MLSGFENPFHLLIIAVVILMLFGAKRLPEMGRSLGSGLRGFKESINGETPAALTATDTTTATALAVVTVEANHAETVA